MELMLGSGILLSYMYAVYFLFNQLPKVIARRNTDFVRQILSSWIIVVISSFILAQMTKGRLAVSILFDGIFYFSIVITLGLFYLFVIIRNVNLLLYKKIINKIQVNMKQ
ncbi:hypothetical protein MKX67_03850 [Cytobacillus sp. FSL W7-1323]|uniref:hypothetical protein n=1 Tax=unclassified Cytobacillus TaxID=2675268 RepID=UPI0030F50E4A